MDASLLLFFIAGVIWISEIRSEATESKCYETKLEIFKLIEAEAFYFEPFTLEDPNVPDEEFKWYKNGSQIEDITTDEKSEIHYHGGGLFFLNVKAADSGNYTAIHTSPSGECTIYNAKVEVYNASYQGKLNYPSIENSFQNKEIPCPQRIKLTCERFKGNFTWYKDSNLLPGQHGGNVWVTDATTDDAGIYICVCTWTHNHRVHNSSATRELILRETVSYRDIEILSPTDKEQFADEGYDIKLNCSILCGKRAKKNCDARWYVNGEDITQMDGYNQTTKIVTQKQSMLTICTTILTIKKVSAEDFQREFMCVGLGLYRGNNATLTLKRKESVFPLVIGAVCVLLICVFAAVLVKYFAIDLALIFRPYFLLGSHDKDARVYDAYVVYQSQSMNKATEDKLSSFVLKILPSVLEDKCGYRLFIQGRDDIPGEDHLEQVEECMMQSRRLLVILSPSVESGSMITDECHTSPETSVMGGFDCQVGLHHALVQREMSVILIELGDTGPQGYTHLPPGLQHLIRESAPIRWPENSRQASAWNSHFWKRVRYLMPVTPAKKCASSAIV